MLEGRQPTAVELRGIVDEWAEARASRRFALSEVLPSVTDELLARFDRGAPRDPAPTRHTAANLAVAVYSRDEAIEELASLRDHVLDALGAAGARSSATVDAVFRFFEGEMVAVLRAVTDAPSSPPGGLSSAASAKDTQQIGPDGRNPIADAFHAGAGSRRRRRLYRDRAVLLAEASKALSRSIRFEDTLAEIARIAVRVLADWTIVDAVDARGDVRRHVLHRDPGKARLASELETDFVPQAASRGVPSHVFRTRESLLIPRVTDEHYRTTARSPRHEEILRDLGSVSYLAVPMVVRGETVGALTFVSGDDEDLYGHDEVVFAEELASRAALAVENSLLYQRTLEAVRVRDDFLSIVSHDLKTPLQSVDMCAQILERAGHDRLGQANAARLLHTIRASAQRMRRLIGDLLDLARIEAGRFELLRAPERVDDLLRDVVDAFEPLAAAKSIRLAAKPIDLRLRVSCERERLHQALANLVSNAVKFTPEGGSVSLAAADEGAFVRLEVRDDGPGISPQDLPRLFDRYWQAKDQSRRGTGIGLSIAKAMVEAHDGSIEVESRLGEGSRFVVRLPKLAHHEAEKETA